MDTSKGYADAIWASRIVVAELRRDLRGAEEEVRYRRALAEEWLISEGILDGKTVADRERQLTIQLGLDTWGSGPVRTYRTAAREENGLKYRLEGALNAVERERDRRRDYENLLRERALGLGVVEQPDEKPF